MNDLQEQLPGPGVEDEDGTVDRLGREVTFKGLVYRDAVNVRVIHKPNELVGKQLPVVLAVQVRLSWLGAVKLQPLSDPLPQHVQSRVGLHDLSHCLGQQGLHPREEVAKPSVEIVSQVEPNHAARGARVDRHVVRGIVKELGPGVSLNIVRVEITPPQLDVKPVLVARLLVKHVLALRHQRGLGNLPLECREEKDVGTGRVHLVALPRVDRLLLHRLNFQGVKLLIEDLAEVHDDGLVDLLPQVSPEDLDQRDLQRRNLPVHEDACQVQLNLETHVHVRPVDCRGPPQGETPVGDLVQTRTLGSGQLLEFHALLKATVVHHKKVAPQETLVAIHKETRVQLWLWPLLHLHHRVHTPVTI
mmetsp:Transcript_12946/g.36299  ORF Transcript_12946/g.36299 Transcript_12946/m.36299 type:complete len:360 (+) Transcript_12946:1817-2896(+)